MRPRPRALGSAASPAEVQSSGAAEEEPPYKARRETDASHEELPADEEEAGDDAERAAGAAGRRGRGAGGGRGPHGMHPEPRRRAVARDGLGRRGGQRGGGGGRERRGQGRLRRGAVSAPKASDDTSRHVRSAPSRHCTAVACGQELSPSAECRRCRGAPFHLKCLRRGCCSACEDAGQSLPFNSATRSWCAGDRVRARHTHVVKTAMRHKPASQ